LQYPMMDHWAPYSNNTIVPADFPPLSTALPSLDKSSSSLIDSSMNSMSLVPSLNSTVIDSTVSTMPTLAATPAALPYGAFQVTTPWPNYETVYPVTAEYPSYNFYFGNYGSGVAPVIIEAEHSATVPQDPTIDQTSAMTTVGAPYQIASDSWNELSN
ncbi:hypothetical protein PFISCL1PPCAC_17812, partial [Pristionchus fissidentatus]